MMATKHFLSVNALAACAFLISCSGGTQEACKAQAAKDSRTDQALGILIVECERRFPATQSEDGSFRLYVVELGREVEVSSATPSKNDRDKIKKLIDQQNEKNEI